MMALPLMEMFYSIQGEGFNTGLPAFFIRLGGCPVGCTWCDVKESWDAEKHPKKEIAEIVSTAASFPSRNVVITGGEPCIYNLFELTSLLQKEGFRTWLETSGSYRIQGNFDWICVSPKKFLAPIPESLREADELKIIVYNRHDFRWAEEQAAMTSPGCKKFLQPEWGREKEVLPLIIDYVKSNPDWRISLQTHKYLNIE